MLDKRAEARPDISSKLDIPRIEKEVAIFFKRNLNGTKEVVLIAILEGTSAFILAYHDNVMKNLELENPDSSYRSGRYTKDRWNQSKESLIAKYGVSKSFTNILQINMQDEE